MKLIVQIPCYNEEQTLPATIADIPREVQGIDKVEILIIDDGSLDKTIEVAKQLGVEHIICNKKNMGLARTFRRGLDACLKAGADIIVNTDGDNQYVGQDIPKLIQPVIEGSADIVVGNRETSKIKQFSRGKKFMQWLGSAVVRKLSGTSIPDAVSGFRAISREAAISLNILSSFSYTIEMLIQAGRRDMAIVSVPIRTNPKTRESRLFNNIPKFLIRQLTTIVRMYSMYQPLKVFFYLGTILTLLGMIPIVRFLYYYFLGAGAGKVQSLIIGAVLLIIGFMTYMFGLVADLISFNRQLLEINMEKTRRMELEGREDRGGT